MITATQGHMCVFVRLPVRSDLPGIERFLKRHPFEVYFCPLCGGISGAAA